jgi:hypothetical protein
VITEQLVRQIRILVILLQCPTGACQLIKIEALGPRGAPHTAIIARYVVGSFEVLSNHVDNSLSGSILERIGQIQNLELHIVTPRTLDARFHHLYGFTHYQLFLVLGLPLPVYHSGRFVMVVAPMYSVGSISKTTCKEDNKPTVRNFLVTQTQLMIRRIQIN